MKHEKKLLPFKLENYCKKEFLTDSPEPSTSSVVSFSGMIQ